MRKRFFDMHKVSSRSYNLTAGMSLIGAVYHEGIIIAHGGGRNGKARFSTLLGMFWGVTAEVSTSGRWLRIGATRAITGELEEYQRLSEATLKQVCATDRLNVEEKFKQPESVKQSHTLVLFTNHLPRVGSTDAGTWRRLTVVPFQAVISERSGVQNYGEVLAKEAGGAILAWAITEINFQKSPE